MAAAPARGAHVTTPVAAPLQLKQPKSSVIRDGRKVITSVFTDDSEMVEEYDVITDELLVRKRRAPAAVGGESPWIFEVGVEAKAFVPDRDLLRESAANPMFVPQETAEAYVFRIRNLPYPRETYSVTIEIPPASAAARSGSSGIGVGEIVVRTTNKKYFKRIAIPPMQRMGLTLEDGNLTWEHKNNTLIITYKKHLTTRMIEEQERKERAAMRSTRQKEQEGPDCKQQ